MLLISSNPEDEAEKHGCVLDLEEKFEKPLVHNIPFNSHCIGSSGGWLLLLENFWNLFVFHPTFGLKFSLPSLESLSGFDSHAKAFSKHWIYKFILFGDPILNKEFGVAVIYGERNYIAFSKNGDTVWKKFDNSGQYYSDIIYRDDSIFALTYCCHIEKYIISDVSRKVMEINPTFPDTIQEFKNDGDLYSSQFYLVESSDDFLLVVRCIGNFVYGDNEAIGEGDLIEEPYKFSVCPYKTTNFYVYKLNFKKTEWEELNNLDDQVLFIGGNQSFSLSHKNHGWCKENSIYFTDDNWDRIELGEDEFDFGGHDLGNFCLTERKVEDKYVTETGKVEPAFWILEC